MGAAGAGCGQVYVCLYESEEVVCNGSHNIDSIRPSWTWRP
jgi:hypothetical protein